MKVIILCGGLGSRLSEETKLIPKPMVKIGGIPILKHIMKIYSFYGFNDFIVATGYKSKILEKYEYASGECLPYLKQLLQKDLKKFKSGDRQDIDIKELRQEGEEYGLYYLNTDNYKNYNNYQGLSRSQKKMIHQILVLGVELEQYITLEEIGRASCRERV